MKILLRVVCTVAFLTGSAAWTWGQDSAAPDYATEIAPILDKYCTGCHTAGAAEGDLSLDSYTGLQRGGERGPAILPGQSESSRLVRVLSGDAEPSMPPEDNEAPGEEEIALLRQWIDSGANGPEGAEPERRMLHTPAIEPAVDAARAITAIAVSPDGRLRAVARFGSVALQEPDGKTVRTLEELPGKVNALHFSRDGSRLITASGVTGLHGVATLWDIHAGDRIREFTAHRDTLYDAELSPDGARLATCSYDGQAIVWNTATGQPQQTLEGHNDAIYDLAFSPDGEVLATASGDETIKLWQVSSGQRLDTLSQPQAEQYAVAFSPGGRFVLGGGADNRIRVWRFVSRTRPRTNPLVHSRFAHEGAVVALAFSKDGSRLVSAAEDNTLKQWETDSFTQLHLDERQPDQVSSVAVLPADESFLVARMDGSLERYPLAAPKPAGDSQQATVAEATAEASTSIRELTEREPNNELEEAMELVLPAKVQGVIEGDREEGKHGRDLFQFQCREGEEWIIEVNAARQDSPLDSHVAILDAQGDRVPRVLLQAVRDSYFTFRGKDSDTTGDFRLHNWEEMELNQYLYAGGEVVKLWHYPQGPDSGFQVYPGTGKRYNYFDTTPVTHALHEPCYIVRPHPPGTELISNGLPTFTVYYENDDDSLRRWGSDSRLTFQAPADGKYVLRLADTRALGGPEYNYELTIRPRKPDFKVTLEGANPTVDRGSGKEFSVTVQRLDGFQGAVRVDIDGLPPGFHATSPVVIQQGQLSARGVLYAEPDAPQPTEDNAMESCVVATAQIDGREVTREVNDLGEIQLGEKPKLMVRLLPRGADDAYEPPPIGQPLELTVAPGETIEAKVQIERNGFTGRVGFGKAGAGRNLPHGVFVDNIGLNGLLIVEDQQEREFFITAAPWVPETTRMFHLRAEVEGNPCSLPVLLHVRQGDTVAQTKDR